MPRKQQQDIQLKVNSRQLQSLDNEVIFEVKASFFSGKWLKTKFHKGPALIEYKVFKITCLD